MKNSLPDSSQDLLIKDGKLLMRSVSVYEILKQFSHIIRLTPFRFEDFLATLITDEEQSTLLVEIHLSLLRVLLKKDRRRQKWLGTPELRDSLNIYLHSVDHINWPTALKLWLYSDYKNNLEIIAKLQENEFQNYLSKANAEIKILILEQLCDQFLLSNSAREVIVSFSTTNGDNNVSSNIYVGKHDNVCCVCFKSNGDLISCAKCPAVYHLKCSDQPIENNPNLENGDNNVSSTTSYSCALCRLNHVIGVTDCLSEDEKNADFKRCEPLGMDKQNRRYWFLVRRLFIVDEDEDDVRYYSNVEQFNEIMNNLNAKRHEKSLIVNLKEKQDEIRRHMQITENLYKSSMKEYIIEDGSSNNKPLGQDAVYKNYINQYSRQRQLILERALREEARKKRKLEKEMKRLAEEERRLEAEEQSKKIRLSLPPLSTVPQSLTVPRQSFNVPRPIIVPRPMVVPQLLTVPRSLNVPHSPRPTNINIIPPRPPPGTPILRYFRTEQGQIIRLPSTYLQRGTPLILKQGSNQTNTYLIRPQITQVTSSAPAASSTTTTITTTLSNTSTNTTAMTNTTSTSTTTTSTTSAAYGTNVVSATSATTVTTASADIITSATCAANTTSAPSSASITSAISTPTTVMGSATIMP